VGEIRDEYDEDERLIQRVTPRSFRVSGRLPIYELNTATGLQIPDVSFDTVGGGCSISSAACPIGARRRSRRRGRVSVEKVGGPRTEVLVALPEIAERRETT
jgi:CBS domain containing-hemolysin-like protein